MWRFILVTFGFLGFAFWEMSGGANYAPRENSIQAQASQPQEEADTELAAGALDDLGNSDAERIEITLASVTPPTETGTARDTARTERVEDKARFLTQPETAEDNAVLAALENPESADFEVKQTWPGAIELFEQTANQAELRREAEAAARAASDIRYVTATSANMRGGPGTEFSKVGRLTEGDEVAILSAPGNGWLELQVTSTGEVGWMADWLISAPAQ